MTIHSAVAVFAHGGNHGDFDWWWIPMMLGMALFWGLVIVGIVWLVRSGLGVGWGAGRKMSAVEVLERRLAEGDLTVEEYRERRAELTGRPDAGS